LRCVGIPDSDQRWRERNRIHDVQIGAQRRLDRYGARPDQVASPIKLRIPTKPPGYTERVPRTVPI
jgi:hypothetical protein